MCWYIVIYCYTQNQVFVYVRIWTKSHKFQSHGLEWRANRWLITSRSVIFISSIRSTSILWFFFQYFVFIRIIISMYFCVRIFVKCVIVVVDAFNVHSAIDKYVLLKIRRHSVLLYRIVLSWQSLVFSAK